MPSIIRLPQHVADMIAAGEVVERPASVVKELIENALDAGASALTVEIKNGGVSFIRVTDNGCGMDPEDAETAFLRHATSKIRSAEDLIAVSTLGFRGEALAAIGAVSRIDLLTRTDSQAGGVSLRLEGGELISKAEAGCPPGTTIIVRDLFYNTPARMKFLKRDTSEAAQVVRAARRAALSHPEVSFRLIKDGKTELHTPGDNDLLSCVYSVFGRDFALDLTPVELIYENIRVSGFITKPSAARGNRIMQHFFVGGRPIYNRTLSAALEEGFKNSITVGRFPGCVLHISLPGELVDVNIHPAKAEIKFSHERGAFDSVYFAVKNTLENLSGRAAFSPPVKPKLRGPAEPAPEQFALFQAPASPAGRQDEPAQSGSFSVPPQESGFVVPVAQPVSGYGRYAGIPVHLPVPASDKKREEPSPLSPPRCTEAEPAGQSAVTGAGEADPGWRVIGETMKTYILVEMGDTLLLVDKHAAHERILYEDLRARDTGSLSQMLISPGVPTLTGEEVQLILENYDIVQSLGFDFDDFGGGSILVRGAPHYIDAGQVENVLSEIAAKLMDCRRSPAPDVRDTLLYTVACKAAVKAGRTGTQAENESLIAQVMRLPDIKFCPHGRPVVMEITRAQLERQFKRA